jgi:hypothetical protein
MAIGDKYRAKVSELEGREQGEAAPPVALTQEQFAQLLAAVSGRSDGGDIAGALEKVGESIASNVRNRRPESYNGDIPHRFTSVFNPDGNEHPAPPLKCKMHEGYWDVESQKAVDRWEIEGCVDGLGPNTKLEVLLANRLEPGEYTVRNHDGIEGKVRVVALRSEATGEIVKLTIAYPHNWVDKASKGRLKPSLLRVFCDIYDIGSEKPEHMLKWLREQEQAAA